MRELLVDTMDTLWVDNRNTLFVRADRKTYSAWYGMKQRCDNPARPEYMNYGGRGICYCPRWLLLANFVKDMGLSPPGLSLDRIDNSQGYYKENCRWATDSEQARNRRPRAGAGMTNARIFARVLYGHECP